MKRIRPFTGSVCHVFNRGVDKRTIFEDGKDYVRFIHDLFEFNDQDPALNVHYHLKKGEKVERIKSRKMMVEIIAFCLMPNHYHLMLRQIVNDGITEFMRKVGTGYTNYFNNRYDRSGVLFQGKYKFVHITSDAHLKHLPLYIHLNPLDISMPSWREGGVKDVRKAIQFLNQYRWSSHLDYLSVQNFPSVTERKNLNGLLGNAKQYGNVVKSWISRGIPGEQDEYIIE